VCDKTKESEAERVLCDVIIIVCEDETHRVLGWVGDKDLDLR